MKFDLSLMPYSRRNSYMVFSEIPADYHGYGNRAGLHMRTVHNSYHTPIVAAIDLLSDGKAAGFEYSLEQMALVFRRGDRKIEWCFADEDTVLIRGTSGSGLLFDFMTETGAYDYIYDIKTEKRTYYMANCYKNNCRYLIWLQKGEILLDQQWKESSSLYSKLYIGGESGFLMVIREIETEWDMVERKYDFDEAMHKTNEDFQEFLSKMPNVPERYEAARCFAAYIDWCSYVRVSGFLKRDAMYMSKNWMTSVWSWDHCFNAIALSYCSPEAAWAQFMIMFDFQDETGLLPDSVNDVHIVWNYCKPPVHGWALLKMMRNMELTSKQLLQAYDCLEKWTYWWIDHRRRGGLFYYNHGNDSGWDNSTAFSVLPPVATPELQAFLILQMEALAKLAEKLGRKDKQTLWTEHSRELLDVLLKKCFRNNLPVAIRLNSGEIIENDSLLPYEVLVLGSRLPEEIRRAVISLVRSEKFYTAHGFATESPKSPFYCADGYWRGPIWAPETMLMLDGLEKCGETELVREAAEKFAHMVEKSGFSENFNALTGEGLRDHAYTWTASIFLILAHEYLR